MTTEPPTYLAIVRRENRDVFRTLRDDFAGEPAVQVMWDRRIAERRTTGAAGTPERRRKDRRGPPRSTWATLDFVLVFQGGGEPREH